VIGQAQGKAVATQLATLGCPRRWRLDRLEPTREQMVDRTWARSTHEREALAQLLEDARVLHRAQIEVPAEEQGGVPRPTDGRLGGAQDVSRRKVRPIVGGVQIGDTEVSLLADRNTGERHSPPLRPPLMDRQLPPLHDPSVPVRFIWAMTA